MRYVRNSSRRPNPRKDPRSAKESKPNTPLFANLPGFNPVSVCRHHAVVHDTKSGSGVKSNDSKRERRKRKKNTNQTARYSGESDKKQGEENRTGGI